MILVSQIIYLKKAILNRTTTSNLQTKYKNKSKDKRTSSNSCKVLKVTRPMELIVRIVAQPFIWIVKKATVKEELLMPS